MSPDSIDTLIERINNQMTRVDDLFDKLDDMCKRCESHSERLTVLETINEQYEKIEVQKPQLWQGWGALAGMIIGMIALVVAWVKK